MRAGTSVEARIRRYLRDVRRNLRGRPAEELASVARSVEEHIREELAKRSSGQPGVEDLEAVLAGMDPPESYSDHGDSGGGGTSAGRDRQVLGRVAFWVMIGGAAAFAAAYALGSLVGGSLGSALLVVCGGLGVVAVILGAFSARTTLGKVAIAGGVVLLLVTLWLTPVTMSVAVPTGGRGKQVAP